MLQRQAALAQCEVKLQLFHLMRVSAIMVAAILWRVSNPATSPCMLPAPGLLPAINIVLHCFPSSPNTLFMCTCCVHAAVLCAERCPAASCGCCRHASCTSHEAHTDHLSRSIEMRAAVAVQGAVQLSAVAAVTTRAAHPHETPPKHPTYCLLCVLLVHRALSSCHLWLLLSLRDFEFPLGRY
jgi:hypothetical protein